MSRPALDHHMPDRGPMRQREIFIRGLARHRPVVPVDPARLEECARRVMSADGYAYMAGGAETERTIAANRAAFESLAHRATGAARRLTARHAQPARWNGGVVNTPREEKQHALRTAP